MAPPHGAKACNGDGRRRTLLLSGLLLVGLSLFAGNAVSFVTARLGHGARGRGAPATRRHVYTEIGAQAGLAGFQGNEMSLYISLGTFVLAVPGVWSTVSRTGQAKYIEKSYIMPGVASGGLEMKSIAGGVAAYFKSQNYAMEESPQDGKIRFVGNLQGSVSQALYLSGCLFGAFVALGFVAQSIFPDGFLGLGSNVWYIPCLTSPVAGWYYWSRAFRRDLVELQLELSDDKELMTLSTLGAKETIDFMQQGVRFQSQSGQLFQLMERGMEYQPGMLNLDDEEKMQVFKEKPSEEVQKPVAGAA